MSVLQFRGPITYCVLQWCHPMLTGTQRRMSCSTRMITLYGDHVIKLDSGPRKGYWQVVLHPESRKLTCMAFDIGRYQFKRLPMGSKVASDIFQRMLDSVYIGLPGVTEIADDMVIFGRNEEEHDRNLILFLETTRKNGLVLNKKKLQFKKEEVSFFGHRWNSTGISPDPKKTESILKMQFPPDKETMHSFLGLVNFLN